jgi:hypothetical protein
MTGLVEIAARWVAGAALASHVSPPLTYMDLGRIHYDIRSVDNSTGLGGFPPYCGPGDSDVLQVVYMVRNDGAVALPAPAVPRLVLVDPNGTSIRPDQQLTQMMAVKTIPPMIFHKGVLAARETRVQADIFLPPAGDIHRRGYKLRVDSNGEQPQILPQSTEIYTPECPPPSRKITLEQ